MYTELLYSSVLSISGTRNIIEKYGVELEIGSDFESFQETSFLEAGKGHVAPMFDPARSNILTEPGFWMKGRDRSGRLMHTQAVKLIDLSEETLEEHLERHLNDYRPSGEHVDAAKSKILLSPSVARICGKVCYHGEIWLRGGEDGYRGSSLSAILPRMMITLALLEWSPGYIFGIVTAGNGCRGFSLRAGYNGVDQSSILWHRPGKPEQLEEWVAWISGEDAIHNLKISPESLDKMLNMTGVAKQHHGERAHSLVPKVA